MTKKNEQLKQMFTEIESIDDTSLVEQKQGATPIPVMGDPEWSDFVLSHLQDDERDPRNKYPKTAGLKRLISKLLGTIAQSVSRVVSIPDVDNRFTSVVEHTVLVKLFQGGELLAQGVGESNEENSDAPYSKYSTAIASSRAMGRAYRDLLGVNTIVAEEISLVAERDDSNDGISSSQMAAIKALTKKLGIDTTKFINMGSQQYNDITDITMGKAKQMLTLLNKYQREELEVPERIR